jgi:hypothetical protein
MNFIDLASKIVLAYLLIVLTILTIAVVKAGIQFILQ